MGNCFCCLCPPDDVVPSPTPEPRPDKRDIKDEVLSIANDVMSFAETVGLEVPYARPIFAAICFFVKAVQNARSNDRRCLALIQLMQRVQHKIYAARKHLRDKPEEELDVEPLRKAIGAAAELVEQFSSRSRIHRLLKNQAHTEAFQKAKADIREGLEHLLCGFVFNLPDVLWDTIARFEEQKDQEVLQQLRQFGAGSIEEQIRAAVQQGRGEEVCKLLSMDGKILVACLREQGQSGFPGGNVNQLQQIYTEPILVDKYTYKNTRYNRYVKPPTHERSLQCMAMNKEGKHPGEWCTVQGWRVRHRRTMPHVQGEFWFCGKHKDCLEAYLAALGYEERQNLLAP